MTFVLKTTAAQADRDFRRWLAYLNSEARFKNNQVERMKHLRDVEFVNQNARGK